MSISKNFSCQRGHQVESDHLLFLLHILHFILKDRVINEALFQIKNRILDSLVWVNCWLGDILID